MRQVTLFILTAALVAAPATAQETENAAAVPSNIAGPDANMAINATDQATVNGLSGDPALASPPAVPVTQEAPGVTDATVTPETNESGRRGFPWGLLGLLGLVGLIGRFRS